MSAPLSQEQKAFVEFFPSFLSQKDKLAGIRAFAGCGKSYLLRETVKAYPSVRFLGLAFNTSIAAENKKSFPRKNIKWFNIHLFARTYLQKETTRLRVLVENGALSATSFAQSGFDNDFGGGSKDLKPIELLRAVGVRDTGNYALGRAINDVFVVFCQSSLAEITPDGIMRAARLQLCGGVIELPSPVLEAACSYAKKLWSLYFFKKIPPSHNYYLKFFERSGLVSKIKEFDALLIDEAQDSNFVTYSIAKQLGIPIVAVGDEHQSIYGFRGTLNLLKSPDYSFYLSSTFRYIPKIADMATKILKGYKGEQVPIYSFAKEVDGGVDGQIAYLSRNNSTMIGVIDQLVKKSVFFKTVKKPAEFFSAALAILEFRLEGSTIDKDHLLLNEFKGNMEALEDYINESGDAELKTGFAMQRRYGKRLYTLKSIAEQNFRNKEMPCNIILSTAHTSKGLEWDAVELLNDFPDIKRLLQDAKITSATELMKRARERDPVADAIVQEINLLYVAITRARFYVAWRHVDDEAEKK